MAWDASTQGAYGSIPGPIGIPNPGQDLSFAYPNLGGATGQATADVMSELQGKLSPETLANLQRAAAQFGVGAGMPGSGLAINKNLLSNVLTTEDLQHQGIGDFLSTSSGISKTQTIDPALKAEIEARNSNMAAAPNPAAAAAAGQNAFSRGLGMTRSGGGFRGLNLGGNEHANLNEPAPMVLGAPNTGANQVITNYLPGTTTPIPGPAGTQNVFDYNTTAPWGDTGEAATGSSYFAPPPPQGAGNMYDVPDFNNPQTPFDPNADYFGLPGGGGGGGAGGDLYDLSA